MRHKQNRSRETATAIWRAARDLFGTKGIRTSLRDIAGRAGIPLSTLTERFPTRTELVAYVSDRDAEEIEAMTDEHIAGPGGAVGTIGARACSAARTYMKVVIARAGYIAVIDAESDGASALGRSRRALIKRQRARVIAAVTRERGRPVTPEFEARLALGLHVLYAVSTSFAERVTAEAITGDASSSAVDALVDDVAGLTSRYIFRTEASCS